MMLLKWCSILLNKTFTMFCCWACGVADAYAGRLLLSCAAAAGTGLTGVDGKPLILKGINWFGYDKSFLPD